MEAYDQGFATVLPFRLDGKGKRCGSGYISADKECKQGQGGSKSPAPRTGTWLDRELDAFESGEAPELDSRGRKLSPKDRQKAKQEIDRLRSMKVKPEYKKMADEEADIMEKQTGKKFSSRHRDYIARYLQRDYEW